MRTAPSEYQKSFYQRLGEKELKGLDVLAKKMAGIWKRRAGVRRSWNRRVELAEIHWKELEPLSEGDLDRRIRECRGGFKMSEAKLSEEALAVVCEVAARTLKLRPYPVQMMAVVALW